MKYAETFSYMHGGAGKLLLRIQVILVRITDNYIIASFKLQLTTAGTACWYRSRLLMEWI